MQPRQDLIVIGLCVGLFVGLLCGLLPLLVGRAKGHEGLAWAGFICCAISGAILGLLLAVPVAIVFTILVACIPAQNKARRYHPEFDDYDDRRPSRYRDEQDRSPGGYDDYDRLRRSSGDDDRPPRRFGDNFEGDNRPTKEDWPQPKQDEWPQPRQDVPQDPPKQEPPSRGFGYREVD